METKGSERWKAAEEENMMVRSSERTKYKMGEIKGERLGGER